MTVAQIKTEVISESIQKKCLNCSGFYQKKVQWCKIKDCPLHPFRSANGIDPMVKVTGARLLRSIRNYCLKRCMSDQKKEVKLCPLSNCSLFCFRLGKVDDGVCCSNEIGLPMHFNNCFHTALPMMSQIQT
jgi:hypothetical protein